VELTAADANTSRAVVVGDEIVVRLPETPTTGYQWHPEVDGRALQLVDDQYEIEQQPRGAAGLHRFTFRALRDGPTVLKLVERRAWEDHGGDEYRVVLQIRS
jgi:predicted secreted protein